MVDAALLEIEGVVFDTHELRRTSLDDAFAELGLESIPQNDPVIADLVNTAAERAFAKRLAVGGAALRPGALDFVREAAAMTRLGIVTRATRAETETLLRLASLEAFFSIVVTADDVMEAKPSPAGYLAAIERITRQRPLALESVIAIEDSEAGILAARAAGIRCVAVGPIPAHIAMEADALVPSVAGQTVRALDQLTRPGQEKVQ